MEVTEARSAKTAMCAEADQAPPVRRSCGAPSLRGGVGVSLPLEASAARSFFAKPRTEQKKRGQSPLGLQQPAFGKRQDGAASDDQVIQHPHVHQRQCRLERLRQHLVGPRWLGCT